MAWLKKQLMANLEEVWHGFTLRGDKALTHKSTAVTFSIFRVTQDNFAFPLEIKDGEHLF